MTKRIGLAIAMAVVAATAIAAPASARWYGDGRWHAGSVGRPEPQATDSRRFTICPPRLV